MCLIAFVSLPNNLIKPFFCHVVVKFLVGFISDTADYLQGKEVATNISKLPEGTVVFEDVSTEKKRGKIAKVPV